MAGKRRFSSFRNRRVPGLANRSAIRLRARPATPSRELAETRADAEAAMAEARRSHDRLMEAIDLLPEGIVFLDAEGRYILWNKRYAELYAGTAELFEKGVRLEDTIRIGVERGLYPEALGREEDWLAERLDKLARPGQRHEQILADGRCILIEERQTGEGGVIGLRIDITELKQREASFRLLFESNPVPMIVCHRGDGRIISVNDSAIAHYGYDREAFERLSVRELQAFDRKMPWDEETEADQATRSWAHTRADGTLIDLTIFSRQLVYNDQPAVLLALIDITEHKRAERRLTFLAQHDGVTGLPSRVILRQRLDDMLSHNRRAHIAIGVLVVGIDNFKAVNDTLGHSTGDRLLRTIARRLRSSLREDDIVARLNSDKFAIVHPGLLRPDDIVPLAQRLLDAVKQPYIFDGQNVVIGASVGIAVAPSDGEDGEQLLKNADLALARTKTEHRGTFRFYEADMDAKAQARRETEIRLRGAIERDELRPYYQPLFDLDSGRITGFEALVRWPDPERGLISPGAFIPVAEDTGLINPLGSQILRRACTDAASWPEPVRVAVNLSPLQFRIGNLLAVVMDALRQSGLAAERLELEITETVMMDKSDESLATLHALRALGVRISMDDFGTGYSSLSYLRSFPFDKIKVDQSFVRGLDENAESQAIVRAIVSLGLSLGVTITAEGIETRPELRCLRAEGCHEGQGFLFSAARPNDEIVALLAAQSGTVAPTRRIAAA